MQAYQCGFAETGTYTYEPEPSSGCKDPFMSMHRGRPSHCGQQRCCDSTLEGKFTSTPGITTNTFRTDMRDVPSTRYSYQPIDSECRYDEITRGQVLHYLHSIDGPITVIGDSMMRQFFLRLVMMMRGQERLLDYHIRTHVQYHVCKEADSFRVTSPTPDGSTGEESSQHLRDVVTNGFFTMQNGAGLFNAKHALERCSHLPRELHFLNAPLYSSQNALLPLYMESVAAAGIKPVIVTAVGYWENPTVVPEKYLNTLLNLTDQASKVVIVSVPTAKVNTIAKSADKPSQFEVITTRNRFMKEWVRQQQQTGSHPDKFLFLDLDAMSQAENRPPLPAGADKHYICSIWWESKSCKTCPPVIIDEKSSLNSRPQIPRGSIKKIQVTEDGACGDETQRNAWQVLLNALVGTHYQESTEYNTNSGIVH